MARLVFIFISMLGTGLTASLVALFTLPGPETIILGDWQELAWEYEKINKAGHSDEPVAEEVKKGHREKLIIHEAEVWRFLPDRKLVLIGKNATETVEWHIKGRGNMLEIKHSSGVKEYYDLTDLSDHKMVLNFETDVQVRGIAKLTFKRTGK